MMSCKTKLTEAVSRRWLHLAVALLPVAFAAPAGAQIADAITAQRAADEASATSQGTIDGLRDRTQDAAGRYAQAMADVDSLDRYNNQLQEQVNNQLDEIASIETQLIEIETTNREVQPLMQQMVDTLAKFVELDVPFLIDERQARVTALQSMMGRADIAISEKYRVILEAYMIELDYGRTLSAYEGHITTGGVERTVEFAQLGRVSLMYLTLDGSEAGYWDAEKKTWVADESYREAVEEAIRVARRDGAPDLLTVPVPAPQEVRS